MLSKIIFVKAILLLVSVSSIAQDSARKKQSFSISGTAGISYEYYGLSKKPKGWTGFSPRKPWNQVRFNFSPNMQFGKNFSIPFNFNFSLKPTNYAGPYSNIGKQSFTQFITNPMNSFGLNPKYKWAEFPLGTQYLNYSELSTGDIGIFGAGFDLRPSRFIFRFFTGFSQQGVNFFTGPPQTSGAYRRTNWMASIGTAEEGKYETILNIVKAKDDSSSANPPPLLIKPQEGFTASLVSKLFLEKGWYTDAEFALSIYTKNLLLPLDSVKASFKPFIKGHSSTMQDYAMNAALGKKSQNFDFSIRFKYIGAGFQTPGYPFMLPDRMDYTANTRFNAWKNKSGGYKMNVVASLGQRVNNVSKTTLRAKQFIGNLNWFTQFNEHFSLNISFNNFGFQAPGGINPYGIRNVSNDFGINPNFTWGNEKVIHLLTLTYNYSKYDERDVITGNVTSNNTHTGLLTYVPTFLKKDLSPDFSLMYFRNSMDSFKLRLLTFSTGMSWSAAKKKMNFRGQLQYSLSKTNSFSGNNNLIASLNHDWKMSERVTWTSFISSNHFKYGNEIIPNNARYLESNIRTGFQYRFGK